EVAGLQTDRLLSIVLHGHGPFQDVKKHLTCVVVLATPRSWLVGDAVGDGQLSRRTRYRGPREHLRRDSRNIDRGPGKLSRRRFLLSSGLSTSKNGGPNPNCALRRPNSFRFH